MDGGPDRQDQNEAVDTESLYKLLDLPKTATTEEIKKSFRRKAMKEHPDKGGDPEKFRHIKEASEILSNPETRELYDQYGMEGVKAGGDPNARGGLFDFFPGGKEKGPRKCKAKLVPVKVTLEKVYEGGSVNVQVERMRTCEKCEGKGGVNAKQCTTCNGQRYMQKLVKIGGGMYTQTAVPCETCQGQGSIFGEGDRCQACQGKRIVKKTKSFDIPIDPGVPHEHDIVMHGEADELPGTLAGDLYFRIMIEGHTEFGRKGADLFHMKKINLLEALTGVCFDLKLLDGQTIKIASAKGQIIHNDQKKVIKRKGMPFFKDPMSKGNLVIVFEVVFPAKGEVDPNDYKKLSSILGQPLNPEANNFLPESNYLEECEKQQEHKQGEGDWEDAEDEEGGHPGQGGGIQCQQQ